MEIPSIPPGFEPLVLFTLKRKKDNQVSYSRSASASETQNVWLKAEYDCNEDSKTTKSLSHRPCEKYNILENSFDDDLDSEQDILVWNSLPKGVIRGCDECNNCQKVTAKWHPEEAQRPDLEEAPVFYPTEEEFEDTLKYISSIRSEAEKYGICRIVPPPSWNPPCPLKERNTWEKSKFSTRVQRIDKLQNRDSTRKILHANHGKKLKKRRCLKNGVDQGNGIQEMKIKIPSEVGLCEAEKFGFETGPDFTLDAFQKYDDDFKVQYFRKNNSSTNSGGNGSMLEEQWQPSVEDIEGEYWRMVEKPTEEIEVLYGADLETGAFGSGFPKNTEQVASATDMKYITSGWNLNNFPRLPGSVLSFESTDISGVVVPWLYIGMCFSSFCWHVEDHHLYSLNYMHWGAPKVWYGVPGSDALKLEAAMRKYLPGLFEEQPDLLHKLVTQLSPSILRSEGVPVYRCIQNPGEFVLTFPRAFHAGFNCGFNCAEAVNVAPVDWLPHGQNAIELYREQGRQTSISHDKLLLGAAREAVRANWEYNLLRKCTSSNMKWKEVCGKDGILLKALKARVEMERVRREFLCKSSQALKMESSFDANSEKECSVCLFDLHLSAAGCHHCSPDKYACLNHAKQLCRCSWSAKFFLFRYDISELGMLVEALEGKLSAVYRWARLDLGLALSSYVSKDNMQIPGLVDSSQGSAQKDISSLSNVASSKEQKEQAYEGSLSSAKHNGSSHSSQNMKPPVVVLALANGKVPSRFCSQNVESGYKTSSCQVSQVNGLKISSLEIAASEKYEGKHSSFPENKDLIVLSDDEGDEPVKEPFVVNGTPQKHKRSAQKPVCADNMKNLDSCIDNLASTTTVTDPELPEGQKHGSGSVCIKVEEHAEAESYVGANPISSCCAKFPSSDAYSGKEVPRKVTPGCHEPNAECGSKRKHIDDETSKSEDGHKKLELDVELRSMNNTLTLPSTSAHQNNLDRSYRPKGPRIAKVVRRIKCNVESLNFGAVHPGKLWCDSHAIYPMGFRSRVRYIDVGAPTNMCYYVSEILDAGRDGPIFMVYVEQRPSEVFIHLSAGRCWEMVRERVNQVIEKHNKLAGEKLPPLQPPGSLDGMEMFGFSSPAIVQVIQAMDQNQVCTDYWKSRPLMQNPQQSQSVDNSRNLHTKLEPLKEKSCSRVERILHGLFRKANAEELHTLSSLLSNKSSTDDQSLLNRLLREEINKHPK